MNHVKFKQGDTVCFKFKYKTPLGEVTSKPQDTIPYEVVGVYQYKHYKNRAGAKGGSHQYALSPYIFGYRDNVKAYQYELCKWSDQKAEVINSLKDLCKALENIN